MSNAPDFEAKARELYSHLVQRGGNNREADLAAIAAALRQAADEALERAAQVAKQSQEDCFCKDRSDEKLGGMPCAACMEAARIEGTLRGLAHRALASPAAVPAAGFSNADEPFAKLTAPPSEPVAPYAITYVNAEQWAAAGQPPLDDKKPREPGCQCHQEEGDSPCPVHGEKEPVASLLPRILAALEHKQDCDSQPGYPGDTERRACTCGVEGLAAELRRYIAERGAAVNVRVEPCEAGGHYRNENGVTFHPSKCTAPRSGEGK